MTAREVVECAERITKRKKEEAKFDAQLHGAKFKDDHKVELNMTPEKDAQAKASLERMLLEKAEEIARRKQGIK